MPFIAFISPGGGEFVMIMLVLILLFGAKDAPRIFRSLHSFLDKTQRAAANFRYKIMYGDIQESSPPEKPYDMKTDYPAEEDASEEEPEDSEPNSESPEQNS
jgi:Sec-independent protein translocase protein TatA